MLKQDVTNDQALKDAFDRAGIDPGRFYKPNTDILSGRKVLVGASVVTDFTVGEGKSVYDLDGSKALDELGNYFAFVSHFRHVLCLKTADPDQGINSEFLAELLAFSHARIAASGQQPQYLETGAAAHVATQVAQVKQAAAADAVNYAYHYTTGMAEIEGGAIIDSENTTFDFGVATAITEDEAPVELVPAIELRGVWVSKGKMSNRPDVPGRKC